jgi:hypothetical protein
MADDYDYEQSNEWQENDLWVSSKRYI